MNPSAFLIPVLLVQSKQDLDKIRNETGNNWPGFARPTPYSPSFAWIAPGFIDPSPQGMREAVGARTREFSKRPSAPMALLAQKQSVDLAKCSRNELVEIGLALRYAGDQFKNRKFVESYLTTCDNLKEKLYYQEYRIRAYVQCSFFSDPKLVPAYKKLYDADPKDFTTRFNLIELSRINPKEQEFSLALAENLIRDFPSYPPVYRASGRLKMAIAFTSRNDNYHDRARKDFEKGLKLAKEQKSVALIKDLTSDLKWVEDREKNGYPEWRKSKKG